MTDEVVFHHGTTMVRRLRLAPGEAMPWHRDPFQRVAVVLRGDLLSIEYRHEGESQRVEITPGVVGWEEPGARVHRAVNVGTAILRAGHGFPAGFIQTRWHSRPMSSGARQRIGSL